MALVQHCHGLVLIPSSYRGAGNRFKKPQSQMGTASSSRFAVDFGSGDDHIFIPSQYMEAYSMCQLQTR